MEVDAWDKGAGAVLSHRLPNDKLHSCAFFSRRLAPAKRNNGVGNRELLAVKLTLEEWWHWLEILVHLAQSRQPDPGTGPPNSLFVPEVVRSQVLQRAHSSRLSCHPGTAHTLEVFKRRF